MNDFGWKKQKVIDLSLVYVSFSYVQQKGEQLAYLGIF